MFGRFSFTIDRYRKIEIIFFLTYFYLFRIITDFEYNYWELHQTGISRSAIEYNVVYGTESLIAFCIFYKILRRLLIHKKAWQFIVFIITFLIAYSIYSKFASLLISNLPFLSDALRKTALKYYHVRTIGYSLAYMLKEFLAIGALAYFIHGAQQDEQMKILKEQQLMSELTYLKAQLQPHFFFNTLNNIYALALQQSKHTAPLVAKLAEMMRYMLYRSDEPLVSLKDEVNFIRNYVEVEKIRYRDSLTIDFDEQGIDVKQQIAPLLLLPFIENAFKHGIEEETGSGFVAIVICHFQNELTLVVTNSIPEIKIPRRGGIGLTNAKKRLAILYPGYDLKVSEDQTRFEVNLTLTLK